MITKHHTLKDYLKTQYIIAGLLFVLLASPGAANTRHFVDIPKGSSAKRIALILKNEGIIKNPFTFRLYLKATKLEHKLQSGRYIFDEHTRSYEDIAKILSAKSLKGQLIKVTFQEGLRLTEFASKLEEAHIIDSAQDFLVYVNTKAKSEFKSRFPFLKHAPDQNLEGYIFPDTYAFRPNSSYQSIVKSSFKRFSDTLYNAWSSRPNTHKLSFADTLSLAAIVEKEAQVKTEQTTIASVYLNRLKIGMKLQADPTVAYAIGKPNKRIITYKDLKVNSPYNTYRFKGLTPTPIASVGLAAFKAVLNPAKSEYLFFVATGKGSHKFSKTYKQHLIYQKEYHAWLKKTR